MSKFSLADLRAAWGSPPAIVRQPKRVKAARRFPVDLGPQNCNLLDVWDFHQKYNYRREASLAVNWLHRRFKEMGQRVRIVKRRYYETGVEPRYGIRIVVVSL